MIRNSPDFLNSSFPNHTCLLLGTGFSRHNFDLLQFSESLWMKSCLLKAGHYVYLILYLCFPLIECVVYCYSYFSFLELVVVLTIVLLLFHLIFCEFVFYLGQRSIIFPIFYYNFHVQVHSFCHCHRAYYYSPSDSVPGCSHTVSCLEKYFLVLDGS